VPIASDGSAAWRRAMLGDSTVREGELFEGRVFEPAPFFTCKRTRTLCPGGKRFPNLFSEKLFCDRKVH
jgi:hypothetical protein